MTLPPLESDRFQTDRGLRIIVQVPAEEADRLRAAILATDALQWGDYDRVSFESLPGSQHFRSLGTGRNAATRDTVTVPCVELSFYLDTDRALPVLEAIHDAHPYEEPVVFVQACVRTRHIRGRDEDNPNRFWNRPAGDWVPAEHRSGG